MVQLLTGQVLDDKLEWYKGSNANKEALIRLIYAIIGKYGESSALTRREGKGIAVYTLDTEDDTVDLVLVANNFGYLPRVELEDLIADINAKTFKKGNGLYVAPLSKGITGASVQNRGLVYGNDSYELNLLYAGDSPEKSNLAEGGLKVRVRKVYSGMVDSDLVKGEEFELHNIFPETKRVEQHESQGNGSEYFGGPVISEPTRKSLASYTQAKLFEGIAACLSVPLQRIYREDAR
ncbi:hypothetical protein J4206_06670 [Candidatus Woesearchaeota archaeon]|nr:hypothetical protein [Candidatus Woesearchaeota archaeon]